MDFTKKLNFFIYIVFITTMTKEIHTCFTYNETHLPTILKSGTSFYQECTCDDPVLSNENIYWIGPDDQVIGAWGPGSASKVYTDREHKIVSLIIPRVTRALSGVYKCVSKGADERTFAISYEIDVYEPLYVIPTNISPQFLINGQDSLIRCSARGHNTPYISWYKGPDFTALYEDAKYKTTEEGLVIRNASKEDEGEYHCTARVPYTGEDVDTLINVEVMTPPKIEDLIATLDDVVQEGDSLTLDCKASGFPLPTYSWRKIAVQFAPYENFTTSTEANTLDEKSTSKNYVAYEENYNKLVFQSVTMDDQGTYECIASNKAGESRQNISIEVLAPPRITEFENKTVEEGTSVEIICDAIGRPQPVINVTYYGPPTVYPPAYGINVDDSTRIIFNLTFEKIHRFHEGVYGCNASNEVGSDEKDMYLTVLYKPFFETSDETVWAWDDNPANLTCDHESQPSAYVEWRFQGNSNLIPTPEQIDVIQIWMAKLNRTTENYLTVIPIKKYLYGTYECIARNHLGEAKKVFHVKQGHKPAKLANNQVNITEVAATSVTFDIQDRDTDGPPLIGFTAEYDEVDNYNITDIHTNRTWAVNVPYKIDKLEPMTEYKVRIAAMNLVGAGPYGEYISFVTPEKSAPEPPMLQEDLDPVLIPANNKILKLKSPEHNGDPIDYYAIRYCPLDGSECIEQRIPPTTELKLHHLHHNTSYRLQMVAHNSVGNSTPVSLQITVEVSDEPPEDMILTAETIIGISVVVVILSILLLDLILYLTLKKGMIANCVHKKNKKKKEVKQSRDKKGLLKDSAERVETLKRPDNGHKEFEYNKSTGIITGKHSAV